MYTYKLEYAPLPAALRVQKSLRQELNESGEKATEAGGTLSQARDLRAHALVGPHCW